MKGNGEIVIQYLQNCLEEHRTNTELFRTGPWETVSCVYVATLPAPSEQPALLNVVSALLSVAQRGHFSALGSPWTMVVPPL